MKRLFIIALSCIIAFTSRPVLAVPMTTLILDNFTGTNGTNLCSHTISPTNTVGASWSCPTGTITIQSNKAQVATGASYQWGLLDSTTGDGTVSVIATTSSILEGETYLVFRYTDSSNWWAASFSYLAAQFHLFKIASGVATEPLGGPLTVSTTANVGQTIQVVLSGSSISATVDGAHTINGSDSFNASATKFGIIGGQTSNVITFEDFTFDGSAGTASFVPAIINAPIRCCEMFPRRLTESK